MTENNLINFSEDSGLLGKFEKFVGWYFRKSTKMDEIHFDLSKLRFIGAYATALFFSWVSHLEINLKKRVKILLPQQEVFPAQPYKMLIDLGVIEKLKEIGVEVEFRPSRVKPPSLPLTIVNNEQQLSYLMEKIITDNKNKQNLLDLFTDISSILIKEIIENSFIHVKDRKSLPYILINDAISSSSSIDSYGVMSVFEKGEEYIEICVGDIGPGINNTLKKSFPLEYQSPFSFKRKIKKSESVLLYAFEFASTSDVEGRKERIQRLIKNKDIDPSMIASGLYSVLGLAKKYRAQFILRTPECIISFDFTKRTDAPIIKGTSELNLNIRDFAHIPGTHYVFRFRVNFANNNQFLVRKKFPREQSSKVDVISPYPFYENGDTNESLILESAIQNTDNYLYKNRLKEGILILNAPSLPISSRVESLYIYSLLSMHHGKKVIFWNYARAISVPPNFEKSKLRPIHSIFVGDLQANSFKEIGFVDIGKGKFRIGKAETISIPPILHKNILRKLANSVIPFLLEQLNKKDVRKEPGPFLIERKYYIKTFFQILEVCKSNSFLELFSVWTKEQLEEHIDVIFVQTNTMTPLAEALVKLLEKANMPVPKILVAETPLNQAKLISQSLDFMGCNKALVLTDVICTGDNITNFLSLLSNFEIKCVITIVDARASNQLRQPVIINREDEISKYPIKAILYETIETFKDLVTQTTAEEPLTIIDPITHKPTLYLRPVAPRVDLSDVIKYASTSDSLFGGHFKYKDTHYTYFLDFPSFFMFLRSKIGDWIKEQIDFINQKYESKSKINICIYNPDKSLTWIREYFSKVSNFEKLSIQEVKHDELQAPPYPVKDSIETEHWIIIIPAMVYGDTARLFVEFISRMKPKSILLLSIVSRMNPHLLTFFSGITGYVDIPFRFATFMSFPIQGYLEKSYDCPVCVMKSRLESINLMDDLTDLKEVINSKLNSLHYQSLDDYYESDCKILGLTEKNRLKVYLRALYESSEYNIDHRRELNKLLESKVELVDLFLQIISTDFFSRQFKIDLLERRLFKAFPLLISRVDDLLESKPPFAIGKYLFAIEYLKPGSLSQKGQEIIIRFSKQRKDLEELCITLLTLGIPPENFEEWTKTISSLQNENDKKLLECLISYFQSTKSKFQLDISSSLSALSQIYGDLARSSLITEYIDELLIIPEKVTPIEWEIIVRKIKGIWLYWQHKLTPRLASLKTSPVWFTINEKENLGKDFYHLNKSLADLFLLSKLNYYTDYLSLNRAKIVQGIQNIKNLINSISKKIYSFVCDPTKCKAASLDETKIKTQDGSTLIFRKEIDYKVDYVFFDLDDLNYICGELIKNWQKHKKMKKAGSYVIFRIRNDSLFVALDFEDDIEGKFDLSGLGGLKSVQDICQDNGAEIEIKYLGESTKSKKCLTILARKFTERS